MSTARMRNLSILTGGLLLVVMTVTVWAFTGRTTDEREVTLHARGMAFYLPGSDAPNPTVRVTVINDDPGVKHDLAVAKLGVTIAPLAMTAGSRGSATFEAPAVPGRYP